MLRGAVTLILAKCVMLAMARVDPQDYPLALFNADIESRFVDDVFQDAFLSVPNLIRKYRYPVEVHYVTTPDGYILEMHRIPHGRDKNNLPNRNKSAVLVMHGFLCSSAVWVLMGPGSGLAYILAEEGYDVWMGNSRGSTYSRRHTTLDPDANDAAYWQFSWDEMGLIDLPSTIDYVLDHTGKQRLHYIAHSQGTTAFFVMGSMRPEYNDKIISMNAMAPVAYMANNRKPLLHYIAPHANTIETVTSLLGIGEFLASSPVYTLAGQVLCRDQVRTQVVCSNILFLLGGWNTDQQNTTMLPVIFGNFPAGASVRQFVHYSQGISGKEFRRYDYGNWLANMIVYGTKIPPLYNLTKVTAPVFLHYSDNDPLANTIDVERLYGELGRPLGLLKVPNALFTHLDFMWAIDVRELLYDKVISIMSDMEANAGV